MVTRMNGTAPGSRRRVGRKAVLLLVLLAGVAVLFSRRRTRPPKELQPTGKSADTQATEVRRASCAAPDPAASGASEDPPPIIDEVQVKKSEVCEGEENLIT